MLEEIATAVRTGKVKTIEALVNQALSQGIDPVVILNDGMIEAMELVGARYQANEIFVPEMLVAAKTMKKGVEVLTPHLGGRSFCKHGQYIIGTVAGDLHDIGKNLVGMMLESAGFEVIDLGVDVSPEKFIGAIRANPDCKIVGVSALLTVTMDSLRNTVKAITKAGCKKQVKIMVGGAPITQEYASQIGADDYARDAAEAAARAVALLR